MMLNKDDFNQNLMNCLNNIFGSVRSSRNANVHLSVCPVKSVLELTIFIFLSQVSLRSLCSYFVRQAEPKILRLVLLYFIVKRLGLGLGTGIGDWDWGLGNGD